MEKPTICVECGHEEYRGRSLAQHFCLALPERMNYVTGETYKPQVTCGARNRDGKCVDWIPKNKEKDDDRKDD